jgi:hypothetical protein
MAIVAAVAFTLALLPLLLGTVLASLVSMPLTAAFALWTMTTLLAAMAAYRDEGLSRLARCTLLPYAILSGAASLLLGMFAPGTAEVMLPAAALFCFATLALFAHSSVGT